MKVVCNVVETDVGTVLVTVGVETGECKKLKCKHCLEWVTLVYTSKLTPDSVVAYLFQDRKRSMWLFCLVWHVRALVCVGHSTVHSQLTPRRLPILRVCAVLKGWGTFWFNFQSSFRATLLEFHLQIQWIQTCCIRVDVRRALAHFCSGFNRSRPSTVSVSQFTKFDSL